MLYYERAFLLVRLCDNGDVMIVATLDRLVHSRFKFTFSRHCAMAELISYRTDLDYFLFLDADMGVINPNHFIEEYIAPEGGERDADLTFYERWDL
jgi:glycosyltransferase involved in cell wall biosynthesis